ncbi:MAG TPA: cation:proton antiporter [Thermoplasmatales archaeon]|nr:cation:proton antiporter [Thermoplasmatales archaeon]
MLLEIGIALILAKTLSYLFEKIKQPSVIGEIFAGVLVGPFVGGLIGVNVLSADTSYVFEGLAKIGIVLLLFLSGIEIGLDDIKKVGRSGVITSLFDVSVAFIFGYIAGQILGLGLVESIAIGNIMVATSVGITVRTLMEMRALHTRVGEMILTVAILDDVLGIIILSVTLGQGEPALLVAGIVIFFLLFALALVSVKVLRSIRGIRIHAPRLVVTFSIAVAFIFAALAYSLGLAAITGSFFAGLVFSTLIARERIREAVRQIGELFFIPLFFVWVGASFDLNAVENLGMLVLIFIPMALIGKVIGCSIGSKICGLSGKEALSVGIGMMPRMEVALVVVTTEITMGVFDRSLANQVLAATILLVIISSVITPIILRRIYSIE